MSKISNLEEKILKARTAYYNTDTPTVSDKIFDAWVDELKSLDPTNKAITMVGMAVASEWKKTKHQIPMGSLDKANTSNELISWVKNKNCDSWAVTEKLDGISIELVYENGKLVQSITRGDGEIGEDISVNVIRMQGVNSKLKTKFNGSIRGEIIMLKSVWKKDFADKANPRNAASGVSKRLDGIGVDKLNILFYQVLGDVEFDTEIKQFQWLEENGFGVPNYWLFKTIDEVNNHWRDYQDTERKDLDYDIDGLVVRINNLAQQMSLGDKDLRPLGAIALKFDNETKESTILDIIWQVGNSGRITPVAIVDPVLLAGATVTRASVYNMSYIEELGLDIGAQVLVARANDVIPRIEELVKGTGNVAKAPSYCPECGETVKMDGENLNCTNTEYCRAQIIGRIKNWVSELNLLEWGDILIEKLVDAKKIKTVADLYILKPDDIAELDRLGDKTAIKCHDILWANNEVSLEVLLGALSIPMIGQSTIKTIMSNGYDTLDKFKQLTAADFEKIPGVGPIKAASLAQGLIHNQKIIIELLKNGVAIKEKINGKLTGSRIAITGSTKTKRSDLEKLITNNGGENKSSVGKSCTHLVIADVNSTSSKAVAARKLGIKLINEEELLNLITSK